MTSQPADTSFNHVIDRPGPRALVGPVENPAGARNSGDAEREVPDPGTTSSLLPRAQVALRRRTMPSRTELVAAAPRSLGNQRNLGRVDGDPLEVLGSDVIQTGGAEL